MEVPIEGLGDWERTHDCGTLSAEDIGQRVLLMGWVWRRRDHGGVIFIDLRDRYGLTQVVLTHNTTPQPTKKPTSCAANMSSPSRAKSNPAPRGW